VSTVGRTELAADAGAGGTGPEAAAGALERLVPDFFVTGVVRQLTQLFKLEPVQRRQAKR
jgi:hypothetical protein